MSKYGEREKSRHERRGPKGKSHQRRHERVEVIPTRKRRLGVVIGTVAAISAAALLAAGLSENPKIQKIRILKLKFSLMIMNL